MNNRFGRLIAFRAMLLIGLFLMVPLIIGLGTSCQSQAPAPLPPAPSPGSPEEPATPPQIEVAIAGFAFLPDPLNIPVGTTVIWYNEDSVSHTVTARDGSFDSGSLSRNGTFSYTFEQAGTFEYYCTFHPNMEGKVVVE